MKYICTDNSSEKLLTIGKIYEGYEQTYGDDLMLVVRNDRTVISTFFRDRFISLEEYRHRKINPWN